ncbi:VIR protein [Plasmodium vivax]|uniref:VIR protein n=1 Tax=Plasmodium vivax TaxID=5855 RepID=A0A1G4E318_PLAVI|nr:VIR protein [Plasmodium vivax]
MGYGWQHTRRVNDMFQRFQGPTCTSNYINTKNEIEQKINTFNYNDPKNYCRNCHEIRKNITEKSKLLQHCYRLSGFHPIESIYRIKEFINKCPDPPNCKNPILRPPKKPNPVRQTNEDSCRGDAKCKPKTVPAKAQKANSPGLASHNPKSRSIEVQTSLEGNIGPSKEKVNSPKDPQTAPSTSSLGTQDDRSKSIVSQPPVNPETIVTQTEPLSVQTPPSGELGTPKSELSPHSSVTGDSYSSSSPQVKDIKKSTASDLPGDQNAGCNQHPEQCPRAQKTQVLIDDNKDALAENSVNGSIVDKTTIGEEHVDGQPLPRIEDTDGMITPSDSLASGDAVLGTQSGIGTDGEGGGHNHDTSHNPNSDHSNILGVNTADGETSGSEIAHSLRVVSDDSCNENSCITRKGDELTDNGGEKSGMFNQIFSIIQQNKDNMITASIPMGILLLLTLIFKVN